MSEQDNLRDRIAVLLYRNRDGSACELAQAIIDEFGLTAETVGGNKSVSSLTWKVVESPVKTRIVGKWERCD